MGARRAVVGSVLAGLAAVGGTATVVASQPPPTHEVQMVQTVRGGSSVLSPKQFTPTVAPTTAAPAPVASTRVATRVASPKRTVAIVPKVVTPKAAAPAVPAWTPPVQSPGQPPNLSDGPGTAPNGVFGGGAPSTPAPHPAPAPKP